MTTNTQIELFHNHKSTCSQKVRLCLAEKNIPWMSRHIDISKQENLTQEYLAMNPNGVVPTIRHHSRVVIEFTVIVEYLDEVFTDDPALSPSDPIDRANMRAWMPGGQPYRFIARFKNFSAALRSRRFVTNTSSTSPS